MVDFGGLALTFSWVARLTVRIELGRSRYVRLVSEWLRVFEDAGLEPAATKANVKGVPDEVGNRKSLRGGFMCGTLSLRKCLLVAAMSTLAALSLASHSSTVSAQAQQSAELKRLDAWRGQWTTRGRLYKTAYSPEGEITITMTCGWSAYNAYMICDHLFSGPRGKSDDITIYTYNATDKSYKFYNVDQSGTPRNTPMTVEGDIWTYSSEMEKDGKKIPIKTINDFSNPGVVTWNTKYSDDAGAHWTLMNEGVDTKIR
jgi:hypothetical protein